MRRRDWRRWSCPAGTKRRSPWKSGSSRWRRRRRSRTRPRDRCSRLGRCRLHDHLRNGHRAWRRRRRSRRRGTRSSRSGSHGRRGLLGDRLWTFSCRGLGGSRFLGSCPHGQQHGRRQRQREKQAHRCKTVWNTTHDTLRNYRNGGRPKVARGKGFAATRAANRIRAHGSRMYQPAMRACVGGPRWYSPVGDRCSLTWESSGTVSCENSPRSSDATTAAAERTAQLLACAQRTQCESCCGCSVGWSWSPPELAPAPWQMTNRAPLALASHGTGLPFASGIRSA